MSVVTLTGHRPSKLGGYSTEIFDRLVALAMEWLVVNEPEKVISGMAQGWDQAAATACVKLQIPFIAAIPFQGQASLWPTTSRDRWSNLCACADEIVVVSDLLQVDVNKAMDLRNRWMVDRCDTVLALWNGTGGGTGNCIRYALKSHKNVVNLWGDFQLQFHPYRHLL